MVVNEMNNTVAHRNACLLPVVVINLGGPGQGDKKWASLKQQLTLLKSRRNSAAGLVLSTSPSPQKSSYLTDVGM